MTDPFRDALVAAGSRTIAQPSRRRPRGRGLAATVTVVALGAAASAAAAETGLFKLSDGSSAELVTVRCSDNADGTMMLTLPSVGDWTASTPLTGTCPTAPGAHIVANADGTAPRPTQFFGSTGLDKGPAVFEVFGENADGKEVVIASLDPTHLGKTPDELGIPPQPGG